MKDIHPRHEPFFSLTSQDVLLTPGGLRALLPGGVRDTDPEMQPADDPATQDMLARIRQLESQNRRLRHLSITDELTCAFNRRHFSTSYAQLVHLSGAPAARGDAIALCLFDIDYFKTYNDTFGHPRGDMALQAVSHAVANMLRCGSDRLFRFGGDEFGVLFRAASAEEALERARSFQTAVDALRIAHPGGQHKLLTASFGLAWHATPAAHGVDAKQIYSAADAVLYAAKQEGRNRVRLQVMSGRAADAPIWDIASRALG